MDVTKLYINKFIIFKYLNPKTFSVLSSLDMTYETLYSNTIIDEAAKGEYFSKMKLEDFR